jgi:hypothetical protein
MWEFAKTTSHGGISVRRIFSFALATIVAAFLWALVIIPNTYAADATWSDNSSISYNGNTYAGPADATTVKTLGLAENTKVYTYVEPDPTGIGTSTANTTRKMDVLYFAPDTDVGNATSVKYETYTYQGPNSLTDPSSPTDVSIGKQSAAPNKGTSSCVVDGGLGWIICPVANLLAGGVDWVFGILSGFLTVRPVGAGQETALFRAWAYMRSFANIAFVIAFLIIIYSQITNLGISNYGIKKLLPRIIIAAILVNISYYICAIAVDISNILGYSIQDVFINIRNSLVGTEGNSWDLMNWKSITSFILSGGALATVGTIGLATTLSTYGLVGSIFLLLPALVTAVLAVLVALLIMAARQAIITILIILAPLAFVAYLLPNTEKWFEKWRSTLMTMLILFPAFSVVYGGSQLAAAVIIQNADSINIVILGMLVQVAPLFITPLLINMSGSLLGKIASFASAPNKAIIDRTRKFSEERAENEKARRMGDPATKHQYLRRYGQHRDNKRRTRESLRKINEGKADNRFAGSEHNKPLHEAAHNVELDKQGIDQKLERDLHRKTYNSPEMLKREMKVKLVTSEASEAKSRIDRIEQELYAGKDITTTGALSDLTSRSKIATRNLALNAIATQAAKRVQQSNLSNDLMANVARVDGQLVRDYAGGIDASGADSALAFAIKERREAIGKLVSERTELAKQFKLSGEQYQALATRAGTVVGVDDNNNSYTFSPDDVYTVEMAIANQLATGSFQEKYDIISKSGSADMFDYRASISRAIPANGIPNAISAFGGKFINEVIKGNVKNNADVNRLVADFIAEGKIKDEALAANDPGSIALFQQAVNYDISGWAPQKQADFRENLNALYDTSKAILNRDPNNKLFGQASQGTKNELRKLVRMSEPDFENESPPEQPEE